MVFFPILFSLNLQTWTQYKESDPWPGRRWSHSASCVGLGGQHQRLVISGGSDGGVTYDDLWILDPRSGRTEKVRAALTD